MQVNLYIPGQAHDSFGVVRAVVKDSTDNDTGVPTASYLDSDGRVGLSGSRSKSAHLSGRWHMVRAEDLQM